MENSEQGFVGSARLSHSCESQNGSPEEALLKKYNRFLYWVIHRELNLLQFNGDSSREADEELMEDLYQEAAKGLFEAWSRFDASKNIRFVTFAYYRVQGSVRGFLLKIINSKEDYASEIYQSSVSKEVNDLNLDCFEEDYLNEGGYGGLGVQTSELEDESTQREKACKRILGEVWSSLDHLDRHLIVEAFIHEQRFSDIANKLGYSTSWVSRRMDKALLTLREALKRTHGISSIEDIF